jgi:hypothetical protein
MSTDLGPVGKYLKVKENKKYPWPYDGNPNRTIKLFTDDVLTKGPEGKYTKHTGICCCNIIIPEEDLIEVNNDKRHLIII